MTQYKIIKVQKRDGRIVDFDQEKITNAIFKAITATGQGDGIKSRRVSEKVVKILNRRFKKDEIPHVEQIQDIVEEVLILEGLVDTAKAYILYREQRRMVRESVGLIDESVERVDKYIQELDWQVKENSNMTYSLQGLNQYAISGMSKKYWLNKIYPKEIREAAASEDFHIHNLETLAPYTFFGREVVVAKLDDNIKLISFKDLYEEIISSERLINEKDRAFAKYPENLYILDRNGWVEVPRIIRKKKNKEMRFVKSEQGRSVIVTDNHPFIIQRNGKQEEVPARDVEEKKDLIFSSDTPELLKKEALFSKKYIYLAEELLSKRHNEFFLDGFDWQDFINNWGGSLRAKGTLSVSNGANSLDNYFELTEDVGYLVGVFIAEGNYHSWKLQITNSDEEIIKKIQRIGASIGVRSYVGKKEGVKVVSFNCSTLKMIFEKVFQIKDLSKNKNLPPDILTYNIDFIKGIIAGIIDGDGSVRLQKSRHYDSLAQVLIRVSSRTLLEQLSILLQFFGIVARDRVSSEDIGKVNICRGKKIIQNYPIYGISFSKKEGVDFPSFKYRKAVATSKHWRAEGYGWNKVLNNKFTTVADEEIFDITTATGTFLCNGLLVHNCAGWDLYDLLLRGFCGVPAKIESKPPKHLRTALGQLVNFLFTLQGETAGANAVSNFDTLLAPFIRYDNLTYPQLKQSIQEFLFNCMVPTRVGFQTPFLNVSLDIKIPAFYKNQPVIIGGQQQKETYGEFQEEVNTFVRAFYECVMEGDAKGRVFTFPIPTVSITKDFDWDNPVLEPMWEATAKYGVNYFSNFVNSDMEPDDVRSMCLDSKEEILVRNSKHIKRLSIKEVAENYKSKDFDKEGWAECKKEGGLQVLSLNPETLMTEWSNVERFLRVVDTKAMEIASEDGKKAVFSTKHPIPIFTEKGIEMKWSGDIKRGDYLISLKKAGDSLSKECQKIGDIVLNEDLAKILGYFVADGNYLFESRKGYTYFGEPKGIQFTFKTGDKENLENIKLLIKKVFNLSCKEKQDPRYNTYYLYLYNSELARKLYNAGFKKYGRLPQIIFNSPFNVIKNFLEFHFKGDGYERRKEIHINDLELSRDLVLLYALVGQPVTYRLRKKSQVIYLQHSKSKIKQKSGWLNNPIMSERAPDFTAQTERIPGINKKEKRMIGFDVLEKYHAQTEESSKLKNSDIYLTRVKFVKHRKYKQLKEFYDIELEKNHLFVHSSGQISFNCCRLRLDNKELYKRGGGLFGSSPKTGSIGVVTINMPRIGYLSKTKKEFFERLGHLMDLAKESLEIKRKALENFMEKGLYPYSRYYLAEVKKMRGLYFGNHFATIGLSGMNEALLNFLGEGIAFARGKKFALEILDFMREKLVKYQEDTGNLYNLEATPAEGTSFRQAKSDREKYPDIITAGTKDTPYYTNSTHLPVNYTDDAFEALKLQDELQTKYTGGCIEKGNKVLTDKGLLPIEDIVQNFGKLKPIMALSYNKEKKISEWDEILEAVKINVKKYNKIRIKGERNLDITTSDWHPFFVLEKIYPNPHCPVCEMEVGDVKRFATHLRWDQECREAYEEMPKYRVIEKRADELKVGDYILQNSYNLYPEKETELNNDLAWLVGFFIGDGCISKFIDNRGENNLKKYKVRFFSEHLEALEKVARILNQYFDCQTKVIQNEKRSKLLHEVATSKKEVIDFFFKYGFISGKKTYNISISQKIKDNLTSHNIFFLLSGLMDSDGHISKRDGDFEYYSVSPKLAEDILEISAIGGIMISKFLKPTKRKNEVDIWRLRIPSYEVSRIKERLNNSFNSQWIKDGLSNRERRRLPVVRVKKVSRSSVKDNQFFDLMTKNNHNYLAGKNCLVFIHNTVLHLFMGERLSDIQNVKNLVRTVCEKFHLPYITLTPTFSICPTHGYLSGEHFLCPQCAIKQPCEVYSRVVGYLRPVQQWNEGKKEEFKWRREYRSFQSTKLTSLPREKISSRMTA